MSDKKAEEILEVLKKGTDRSYKSLESLSSAAMKAAGAIYGSLPKSLSDIVGEKALGGSIAYLERNLEAMRGFTTFGVDFGNEVDQMIISATASRVGLDGFARIVSKSGADLTKFGATANAGMDAYIRAQTSFYKNFPQEEQKLKRLGFTVDEITDTFLTYDKISNTARVRTNRTDDQRNRAAVEFSVELDKLSKLTGKQREQIATNISEASRKGDVQGRAMELSTEYAVDSLNTTVGALKEAGPAVQNLARDILTKGFPVGESKRLFAIVPEFRESLYALRKAQESGNEEEIRIAQERVMAESALLRQNKMVQRLSVLQGVTAIGDTAGSILETTASYARGMEVAKAQLEKEAKETGKTFNNSDVRKRFFENAEKEQAAAVADAKSGTQQIQQAMIEALTVAQRTATEAQVSGTQRLFQELAGPIGNFGKFITDLDFPGKIKVINDSVTTMVNNIKAMSGDEAAAGVRSAQEAIGRGSNELAREIFDLTRKLQEATGSDRVAIAEELKNKIKKVDELPPLRNMLINAQGVTVIPDRTFIEGLNERLDQRRTPLVDPGTEAGTSNSIGTMGTVGRLFKDFGKETNVALHGLQSVQTPKQTAEVVKQSVVGTMQAFADSLRGQQGMEMASYIKTSVVPVLEQMSGSTIQVANGMLNTIQNSSRVTGRDAAAQNFDVATFERLMKQLAIDMKTPVEEALKALQSPMERLANISQEQLSTQQRQLRGIKGMSGDVLRGMA